MIRIAFFIFVLCSTYTSAQNAKRSIEKGIDSFSVRFDSDPDSAFYYINKAHKESLALQNDSLMARTYFNLGYFYNSKKYDKTTAKSTFIKL